MTGMLMSFALVIASIATALHTAPSEPQAAVEHCVAFVVGHEADGELITTDQDCFADEASAESWAQIGMAYPSTAMAAGGDVVTLSTFTLGRHYDGYSGTGSSIRIVGSSCTGGYWNVTSSWLYRISSSYNGCARLRHYAQYNKVAPPYDDTEGSGTTDNLNSTLNNNVKSVSYHSG